MTPESIVFAMPGDAQSMEMGTGFSPRFDVSGLIPTVAVHAETGEILMLAYMNVEALRLTLASGDAHYFSRSRQAIWRKGETSGQVQRLVELRVDCDQDALVLRVIPQGDGKSCHVGYRSCFYRSVTIEANSKANLVFSAV